MTEPLFISSGTKQIERIAAEYNHMLYLVHKGKGLRFVEGLSPRIDHITSTLERDLSSLLTSTLTSSHDSGGRREALLECFRTYEAIGKVGVAEAIVRKELVKNWVVKVSRNVYWILSCCWSNPP
jgi:hypothetical protein